VTGELVGRDAGLVCLDARPVASLAWDGDLDGGARGAADAPEQRGRSPEEDRAVAAGENGRHPVRLASQGAVADGVDAAVQHVEAASRDAVVDGIEGQAQGDELPTGHHPVLPVREAGDQLVDGRRPTLTAHIRHNVDRVSHDLYRCRPVYARPR
jgi:hypothetical protein